MCYIYVNTGVKLPAKQFAVVEVKINLGLPEGADKKDPGHMFQDSDLEKHDTQNEREAKPTLTLNSKSSSQVKRSLLWDPGELLWILIFTGSLNSYLKTGSV